jgi:hypothetical protein
MCVDRARPELGYVKSNAVPACLVCNQIKSDLPPEAWAVILLAVRQAAVLGVLP